MAVRFTPWPTDPAVGPGDAMDGAFTPQVPTVSEVATGALFLPVESVTTRLTS